MTNRRGFSTREFRGHNDPNGHRLEVSVRTDSTAMWSQMEQDAVVEMDKWNARKAGAIQRPFIVQR